MYFVTQDRESPEVRSRLDSVERRYHELLELTELRKQRLLDALALYKLYNDADGVEQWIAEKARSSVVLQHQCFHSLNGFLLYYTIILHWTCS